MQLRAVLLLDQQRGDRPLATTARRLQRLMSESAEKIAKVAVALRAALAACRFWSPPLVLAIRIIYAFLGVSRRSTSPFRIPFARMRTSLARRHPELLADASSFGC